MGIDEILVYAFVAAASGAGFAYVVRNWNRPFFRPARKAMVQGAWHPYAAGVFCRKRR